MRRPLATESSGTGSRQGAGDSNLRRRSKVERPVLDSLDGRRTKTGEVSELPLAQPLALTLLP